VSAPHELARRIVDLVKGVQDVLLLYYVGHGMRTANGQLALAVQESSADSELLPHTAIMYEAIARILRGSPAVTKLVILDCCHAELGKGELPVPVRRHRWRAGRWTVFHPGQQAVRESQVTALRRSYLLHQRGDRSSRFG